MYSLKLQNLLQKLHELYKFQHKLRWSTPWNTSVSDKMHLNFATSGKGDTRPFKTWNNTPSDLEFIENTSVKLTFVVMATKLQCAHLKRCDWQKPQRQHAGGGRNKSTSNEQRERKQNLSHVGKEHVFNINLFVKLVMPFILQNFWIIRRVVSSFKWTRAAFARGSEIQMYLSENDVFYGVDHRSLRWNVLSSCNVCSKFWSLSGCS